MSRQLESDSRGSERAEIDSLIFPLLTRYTHIGIVVGMIENKQTDLWGYGKVGKISARVPDETTLFEIGSITKVFTALLLATM